MLSSKGILVKKLVIHILVFFASVGLFSLLYYAGNRILKSSITITEENYWLYENTLLEILVSPAIGYCVMGYITQIIVKRISRVNNVVFDAFLFLSGVMLFVFLLGGGFYFSCPFDIKNLFVITFTGYLASLFRRLLFKKSFSETI